MKNRLLPIENQSDLAGADCVLCAKMGQRVTARYLNREEEPVCKECKSSLIRLDIHLFLVSYAQGGRRA